MGSPHIWPKKLGAVVLLDQEKIVSAVGRVHRVHVGGLLQPEAALTTEQKSKPAGISSTEKKGTGSAGAKP